MASDHRRLMDKAMRAATNEVLRPLGFKGSQPHLRRQSEGRLDLFAVQFARSGASFALAVGIYSPERPNQTWGLVDLGDMTVFHLRRRNRIGPNFPTGDNWFSMPPWPNKPPWPPPPFPMETYQAIADEAFGYVEAQAVPYWKAWVPGRD